MPSDSTTDIRALADIAGVGAPSPAAPATAEHQLSAQALEAYILLLRYPMRVALAACARLTSVASRRVLFLPPVDGRPADVYAAGVLPAQEACIVYTVDRGQPVLLKHRHRALPTIGDTFNWDMLAADVAEHGTEEHDKALRLARALYSAPAPVPAKEGA